MATRRERVVLELEDNFTSGMARAAASAALLNRELDSLSKDSVRTQRSFTDTGRSAATFGRNLDKPGAQIDRLSGRLRVLTDVATILTPALSPIGGVIVPAISGLASQLGFAAVAGGTAILAFQGIGDTLKALDKAALDPTRENIEAANLAMAKLSPSAQKFATEVRALLPQLRQLRDVAAEGLFPGVIEGLDSLEAALPRVERIVSSVSTELGNIAADTGASLASDRWAPFLDFIAQEAPEALADMADAAGSVAHSMANMWMAFDPLNDDFSNWLVDATASLDEWSAGLSQTEGFQEFVSYVRETGPQVADTFAAIGDAVVQLVQATAPLGGPVLAGIEAFAKAFAAIADSDLGTPLFTAAAALALFNRTMAVTTASRSGLAGFGARLNGASTQSKALSASVRATRADLALLGTTAMTAGARTQREMLRMNAAAGRLKSTLGPIGKGGALLGGLAVASSGAADGIGLTNTASLALMGTLAGPWGAVIGGAIGGVMDLSAAAGASESALRRYQETLLATAGPSVADQLAAVTAEIKEQQKVMRDEAAPSLNPIDMIPLALNSNYQTAKDKVNELKEAQAELEHQIELGGIEADRTARATGTYADVLAATGGSAGLAAGQIDTLVNSMRNQRLEALSGFSAETRYRQALSDARKQAAESDAGIRGNSEEALKNRTVIEGLATAWNNQSEAVKNNRAKFREARDAFVETATAMGIPEAAAKRLARRLLEIPKRVVINTELRGGQEAIDKIRQIKEEAQGVAKRYRLDFIVNQTNAYNKPKPGEFATGGWTGPGAKYQPAGVVHADEYVFSKEATSGNVAYLDALHRQMRGYADGGLVRRYPAPSSPVSVSVTGGPSIDYDQLARAMSAVRPLYGDVQINGDPTVFRRQLEQDRRLSRIGGVPRG